jgi:hypothetical protein
MAFLWDFGGFGKFSGSRASTGDAPLFTAHS